MSNAAARTTPSLLSSAADLLSLTKPRLSSQVLFTAAGGMYLAPGQISPARVVLALLTIAATVGAANALNCYMERESDRHMARTRNRPLPAGRMEPAVALGFGLSLVLVAIPMLSLSVNRLTGLLGFIAFASYVFVYTPLKARTEAAMVVGALPGALPPLMGWTAVTGTLDLGGLSLFGILFLWQLPHFLAISLYRKHEYRAAGLTVGAAEGGEHRSRWLLLLTTVALVAVSVLPSVVGITGRAYLVAAAVLGAGFLFFAGKGVVQRLGAPWARRTFAYSLVYLSGLFLVLMLDAGPRG
ncbi:MAG: heme o synthase [Myxococcaceae bacterium]|nr:heme o synthase [Myxococcaceae bacterium]